jgi:hypothetical protein
MDLEMQLRQLKYEKDHLQKIYDHEAKKITELSHQLKAEAEQRVALSASIKTYQDRERIAADLLHEADRRARELQVAVEAQALSLSELSSLRAAAAQVPFLEQKLSELREAMLAKDSEVFQLLAEAEDRSSSTEQLRDALHTKDTQIKLLTADVEFLAGENMEKQKQIKSLTLKLTKAEDETRQLKIDLHHQAQLLVNVANFTGGINTSGDPCVQAWVSAGTDKASSNSSYAASSSSIDFSNPFRDDVYFRDKDFASKLDQVLSNSVTSSSSSGIISSAHRTILPQQLSPFKKSTGPLSATQLHRSERDPGLDLVPVRNHHSMFR